jgi:hypothetical protein
MSVSARSTDPTLVTTNLQPNNIEYTYQIKDGKAVCLDCPVEEESEEQGTETDSLFKEETIPSEKNDGEWQYDGNDGVSNEWPSQKMMKGWITKKTDVSYGPLKTTTMNALIYFLRPDPTINREILRTASFMEWFLLILT